MNRNHAYDTYVNKQRLALRDTLELVEHAQKYIEQTRPSFVYTSADYEAWLLLDAAMRRILRDMS